jgi:hypothetical protein
VKPADEATYRLGRREFARPVSHRASIFSYWRLASSEPRSVGNGRIRVQGRPIPGADTNFASGILQANDQQFAENTAQRLTETQGSMYGQVVSLSGAGMRPDWHPNVATRYDDYSYFDLLQTTQNAYGADHVWDGNTPRHNDAFSHGSSYIAGESVPGGTVDAYEVLLDEHNRVARIEGNRPVLNDLVKEIHG